MNISLRPPQGDVFLCPKRFRVLVAGRRFGKTFLGGVELYRAAADPVFTATPLADRLVWYIAPNRKQAKRVAWENVKKLTRPYWLRRPNETELSITLKWGARIQLQGAENYDSLRGPGLDFALFDEYADINPKAWTEVVRPMLSDRLGKAMWIGTPKGFNHLHELWAKAADQPDWASFRFTTEEGGNVSIEEIAAGAADLDAKTFAQEYQASFENMASGRVYYAFERSAHISPQGFIRSQQLCWALDFNVDPMCSVICQIEDFGTHADAIMGRRMVRVRVLDEISLPDANVPEACAEFKRRTQPWLEHGQLKIQVYGDSAGNSRSHAGPSAWQLVKEAFRGDSRYALNFRVPTSDPPVRDRVTAVNAMLRNSLGEVRIVMDPRCRELAKDLEQVTWKADSAGNITAAIDKKDPKRTHVSDGLGYLIHREFPLRDIGGAKSSPLF